MASTISLKHWTVKEYDAMLEKGILTESDRLELVNGQIIQMSPQNPPHAAATKRSYDCLKSLLPTSVEIRSQLPVILNDDSEPEPDIAVVRLDAQEYSSSHPRADDVLLIIEISDSTLDFDLGDKALAYAKSEIEDYWVVDVRRRLVHVLRRPIDGVYVQRKILKVTDIASCEIPLLFPNIEVPLFRLLPIFF